MMVLNINGNPGPERKREYMCAVEFMKKTKDEKHHNARAYNTTSSRTHDT